MGLAKWRKEWGAKVEVRGRNLDVACEGQGLKTLTEGEMVAGQQDTLQQRQEQDLQGLRVIWIL